MNRPERIAEYSEDAARGKRLLQRVAAFSGALFRQNLVGVYAHGSLAFGCFLWATGDLDFLIVVREPVSDADKEAFARALSELEPDAPPKGFETSVVLARYCRDFVYPTPYEFHYSASYREEAARDPAAYSRRMHGTDPDLAAHFTVVKAVGFAVSGAPVKDVFGPVPREAYLKSVLADVGGAESEAADNPPYYILNLLRVLKFLADGSIVSKRGGGEWGLKNVAERFVPLVKTALEAYRGETRAFDPGEVSEFARSALRHVARLAERA